MMSRSVLAWALLFKVKLVIAIFAVILVLVLVDLLT